ncbi:MAG: hypothetical protein QOJ62_1764, partial [Actinomycetota bacterium]|nr:hypothetical protein [Actinomycetota bacterium]
MHKLARLVAMSGALATAAAMTVAVPAATASTGSTLPVMDPAGPMFTQSGGATPLATDRTVPHWHGSYTDPTNG